MRALFFFSLSLLACTNARAEMDPSFFQIGSEWFANVQNKPQPDYDPGYPGTPIVDKFGRLVVFEGLEVERNVAEKYVEEFNKPHQKER